MGYPKVGASNYWLSSETGSGSRDYMKIDVGCNIMINSVKVCHEKIISYLMTTQALNKTQVRNLQSLAFNKLSTEKLIVKVTKWNDDSTQNEIVDEDLVAPEDQV